MRTRAERWLLPVGLVASLTQAISLDTNSASSIKDAASAIAFNMMTYYYGNQTGNNPGNLAPPFYWWEAGAMFAHIVDYYYYTGDPTYNAETIQAITWQAGTDGEFMPQNQTLDEGNDDQVFWAFTAMEAAEMKFPDPGSQWPSYTAMGQAVFNLQAARWDPSSCGGGLRWQITSINQGYNYKNTPSNMGFFQLAARLARYTGNQTYIDWAEKSWNWFAASSLLDASGTAYKIYDGAGIEADCQKPNIAQYSYNYGITLAGLAYMYNHTSDPKWLTPLYGVLNGTIDTFFPKEQILSETGCEPYNNCNTDGLTFKSFTIRWLAVTTQLVPETWNLLWPYIVASADGAAQQCDGADTDGQVCGYHWDTATYDGTMGVGQQMSALAAIQANLITTSNLAPPLTLDSGGTSKSDPSAGTGSNSGVSPDGQVATSKITTGDRAGAGIITAILLVATVGGAYWLAVM